MTAGLARRRRRARKAAIRKNRIDASFNGRRNPMGKLRKALVRVVALLLVAAVIVADGSARASDPPAPQRLPFCDDVAPPPPLPRPLDRAFQGELVDFDGERVSLRWKWKSDGELADFEPFVPVRGTLSGSFAVKDGRLWAEGTAGIRLRLGLLPDLELHVPATLTRPHDLGIVLPVPGKDYDSIVCLVQDILFTHFDAPAGHSNMINRLGGVPSATAGMSEFRYIARSVEPQLAEGQAVQFDVVRKTGETSFTITPTGKGAVTLRGRDNGSPITRFTPGLYVSGGQADFGELTIEGRIDPQWCTEHGLLPFVAGNLLHAGNRWKAPEKKSAELVERFARQDAAAEKNPKNLVAPELVAALVGDVKTPLVIRIRAAEALVDRVAAGSAAADVLAALLDAKDPAARTLAWQVLHPRLPWHFRYEVDADPKVRRDAAQGIAAYLHDRMGAEAEGKVFVEGAWYSPEGADTARSAWEHAWDVRSARVRVRTDLPRQKADWYLTALEAEYRELVRLVGREPPPENLPLSVFVFKDKNDFGAFCKANGYEGKAAWGRFADVDKNVSFTTFVPVDGIQDSMGQFAKQFLRYATGKLWPTWFDEGRAAWFGSAEYGTARFDGQTLTVGLRAHGPSIDLLKVAATESHLPGIGDVVAKDPRTLTPEQRRLWYAEAWALHAWFMEGALEPVRARFAEWQSAMETQATMASDVDDVGRREFAARFEKDLPELDGLFRGWVAGL
jgi:hypothetical protein